MTLDQDIQKIIPLISENLDRLSQKEIDLTKYTMSNLKILNISTTGKGNQIAEIKLDVNKSKAYFTYQYIEEYTDQNGNLSKVYDHEDLTERDIKSLEDYWFIYHQELKKPQISDIQKAIATTEFKENLIRNFQDTDTETIKKLTGALDNVYQILVDKKNKQDIYSPIPINVLTKVPIQLKDVIMLKIINLQKGLFIDNKEKIEKHEKQGRFYKNEPCKILLTRQIVYE